MKYLITGGCGFLGSNLADEVLKRGDELHVLDNLFRQGSSENLKWLKNRGELVFHHSDIRNYNDIERVVKEIKPDVIFHLAGQVAMTTSIDNPRLDFEINTLGTHNLLEAVRKYSKDSVVLYSSTNKVYGDFSNIHFHETPTRYVAEGFENGFDEKFPLEFHSPYGCSKGAADQYLMDYSRIFGLKTIVFRHSSMYGGRQFATFDQGWVGWFCQKAIEIKKGVLKEPFTISGSGKQVRDLLYADDMVNLYFLAAEKSDALAGNVFNIGGGVENSYSLIELFSFLEKELNIEMRYKQLPWRESDQKVFVADTSKIKLMTGWEAKVSNMDGVRRMLEWTQDLFNT